VSQSHTNKAKKTEMKYNASE